MEKMKRAQWKQAERANKQKEKTYVLTRKQIEQMKEDVEIRAVENVVVMMYGFPMMVLRDKFGFGSVRLERFLDEVCELYDSYTKGYISIQDLHETVKRETGAEFRVDDLKRGGRRLV